MDNTGKFAVTLRFLGGELFHLDEMWGTNGVRIFDHPGEAVDEVRAWTKLRPLFYIANMNGEEYHMFAGEFLSQLDGDSVALYLEDYYYSEEEDPFIPQYPHPETSGTGAISEPLFVQLNHGSLKIDTGSVLLEPDDGYAFGPGATGIWHNAPLYLRLVSTGDVSADDLEVIPDEDEGQDNDDTNDDKE